MVKLLVALILICILTRGTWTQSTCESSQFSCNNGRCTSQSYVCDGDDDCKDLSDERNCEGEICSADRFKCKNGQCINKGYRCDGKIRCLDKSDEANCTTCASPALFHCSSLQCISQEKICDSKIDCLDGSDEYTNCQGWSAPNFWTEFWHDPSDNSNVSLFHIDENVALYWVDGKFDNLIWLFRLLSSAWRYATENYGLIWNGRGGSSSILHIVLHNNDNYAHYNSYNKPKCLAYTSLDSAPSSRNLIDCNLPTRYGSAVNFQTIVSSIGEVIEGGAKGIFNDAGEEICGNNTSNIIAYDIYLYSRGASADVTSWRGRKSNETFNNNFCFRDWFLPIYEMEGSGGVKVLNKFYNLTKSRWLKRKPSGYKSMNLGEYVHFWSESAGINLEPLASKAFSKWNKASERQLLQARKSYHFHDNFAQALQYKDNNVGIYFKNYPTYTKSTFKTISKAWGHVKKNYISSRRSQSLSDKIIFYNETLLSHKGCSSITNEITSAQEAKGYLYVVDCVASSGKNFYANTSTTAFVRQVIKEMGKIPLNVTQSPGLESWLAFNVSGWTIAPILVYDIYHGAGMSEEAGRWASSVEKLDPLPRPDKYWFRDWYHTIYFKHGKTAVLKGFLSHVRNRKNNTQINLGEFVHFWSMAAKTDLHDLAKLFLGWSDANQIEFVNARNEYLNHGYSCDVKCNELPKSIQPADFHEGYLIPTVAGVSAFGVALLTLAFGIKIYLDRKKIKSLTEQVEVRNLSDEEVDEFYKGNPNLVGTDAHAPIQAMPFNMNYEIPHERLKIDDKKVLGSGEFGLVKQGLLKGDSSSGRADTTVAVKMVKPSMDVIYFKAHLSEIKIMAFLGDHENIAKLVGTVTSNIRNGEVFVAMEFCAKGDLLHYLKDNGKNFVDLFRKRKAAGKAAKKLNVQATYTNAPEPVPQCTYTNAPAVVVKIEPSGDGETSFGSNHKNSRISTLNLLQWSRQIANGMAYLKAKHVIHGDLAARNVLIGSNDIAKISDFGLSRQLVNYSNYKKTNSETPLPWRWLAIESLENMIFSPLSDVWAFGVTLWEIFTLGKIPYPGKTWNQEFVDGLMTGTGQRLPSPTLGNQEVYDIILNCMKTEPSERISLPEIISQLETVEVNLSYF